MDKCFADIDGECTALEVKSCDGCAFYKTEKQLATERQQTVKKLNKLGVYDIYKLAYGLE